MDLMDIAIAKGMVNNNSGSSGNSSSSSSGSSVQSLVIRCTDDNIDNIPEQKYHWHSSYSYRDIITALSSGIPVLVYSDFHIQEYDNQHIVSIESIFTLKISSHYNSLEDDEYLELGEWADSSFSIDNMYTISYGGSTLSINNIVYGGNTIYNTKLESSYAGSEHSDNYIFVDSEEDILDAYPVFYYYVD